MLEANLAEGDTWDAVLQSKDTEIRSANFMCDDLDQITSACSAIYKLCKGGLHIPLQYGACEHTTR